MVADKQEVSFWGDGCVLKLTVVMYIHSFVNTAKVSEVHSLNGRIVWHINYITIKLLKKRLQVLFTPGKMLSVFHAGSLGSQSLSDRLPLPCAFWNLPPLQGACLKSQPRGL